MLCDSAQDVSVSKVSQMSRVEDEQLYAHCVFSANR
jgi:hypothetical protein